ncbi:hypothetical protein [Teredinibacter haidensis]|uniref:hypothetical protein n=1 Tax=Teredinibacter haidensis TaxID=2731755 RepID=UPI000948FAA1|nr:hypothetical protein [Teredinibacter haidensis]
MGIEVLDSSPDLNNVILENTIEDTFEDDSGVGAISVIDARRKLENKIEEMRLLREMQEFDFDV